MVSKKKKPAFNVPNLGFFKSVKARWRRPRGTANKKRMKYKFMGANPKVGYRNAVSIRGMHPCGKREVLLGSLGDLEALKGAKDVVLRFASGIGERKRKLISEKAKAMGLRIVNVKWQGEGKFGAKKPHAKAAAASAPVQKPNPQAQKPKGPAQGAALKPAQTR